jgi:hypothetical protein
MKTIGAISLIVLLLFTGIKVSVATHYCCGNVAGTKISLSGEKASCGMESRIPLNFPQDIIEKHCCDNVVTSYYFSNNYFPTFYNFDSPEFRAVSQFIVFYDVNLFAAPLILSSNNTGSPPGTMLPFDDILTSICVFRI